MVFRLVLGCGTVGRHVVEQLAERDSAGRLLVVTDDESVVGALRDESVPARHADPTDPTVLENIEQPDVIFVGGDRTDVNRATLEAASDRFPAASIVAHIGGNPTTADRRSFDDLADHVVDPNDALVDGVLDEVARPTTEAAIELRSHLESIDGRLGVVMHDNPDPDAIASAVALVDLAESVGIEAEACYFGEISHQENRAMINLLSLDLRNLVAGDSLERYDAFALVDHSRPG